MNPDLPYFVMLVLQDGSHTPLLNPLGQVQFFELQEEATTSASTSLLGKIFGFEVFEIGGGVHSQ